MTMVKEQVTDRLLHILGMENFTPDLDEEGVKVDVHTVIKIIDELSSCNTHRFRGHVNVEGLCNIPYPETSFIACEGNEIIYINSNPIYLNHEDTITFYISYGDWYDLIFNSKHGSVTICCLPK